MLFVTVEHSGTFATIKNMNWSVHPLEERGKANYKPSKVLFAHLYDKHMDAVFNLSGSMPVVTTFRPEADIRKSWVKRNRKLGELDRQLENYRLLLASVNPIVIKLGSFRWQ